MPAPSSSKVSERSHRIRARRRAPGRSCAPTSARRCRRDPSRRRRADRRLRPWWRCLPGACARRARHSAWPPRAPSHARWRTASSSELGGTGRLPSQDAACFPPRVRLRVKSDNRPRQFALAQRPRCSQAEHETQALAYDSPPLRRPPVAVTASRVPCVGAGKCLMWTGSLSTNDPLLPLASVEDEPHALLLPDGIPLLWRMLVLAAVAVLLVCPGQVLAAGRLQEFLPKAQPAEFFPGADRFGPPQGDPPLVPAYAGRPAARLRLPQLGFRQRGRLFRQADPHAGRHRPARRDHGASSSSTTRSRSSSSASPSTASSMR